MKKIILASKSPRRLEILNKHGIEPIVMPSETEEILPDGIGMEDAVRMLALQKAEATYEMAKTTAPDLIADPDTLIIGSDTIVYKGEIMGKPQDAEDAFRMLSMIRGTEHYVATGVAILDAATGKPYTSPSTGEYGLLCDVTTVYCKDYSDEDIRQYIEQEQPYDKAGSYAIQGSFGRYIDHIDGDYENVMGLPFHRIEPFL